MNLNRLINFWRQSRSFSLPPGKRIYAIGDIHGCHTHLNRLLDLIEDDAAARPPADSRIIILGDTINRGPDSRGVVEKLLELSQANEKFIFIKGNHEEILIRTFTGDRQAAGLFNRIGGRETLRSYGVSDSDFSRGDLGDLCKLTRAVIPEKHIAFLEGFQEAYESGDYFFVHAGVRPGIPLGSQKAQDMRWIRKEFLDHRNHHGKMIVHGHNITNHVDIQPNRLGVDTGAYRTGKLSAVGIEDDRRWLLSSFSDNELVSATVQR